MTDKQRIQFDFSPEMLVRLEKIQAHLDGATKVEAVRTALGFYDWFINLDEESLIEIQDKEGKATFRIPVRIMLSYAIKKRG